MDAPSQEHMSASRPTRTSYFQHCPCNGHIMIKKITRHCTLRFLVGCFSTVGICTAALRFLVSIPGQSEIKACLKTYNDTITPYTRCISFSPYCVLCLSNFSITPRKKQHNRGKHAANMESPLMSEKEPNLESTMMTQKGSTHLLKYNGKG